MEGTFYFIVEVKDTYHNTKGLLNGQELLINNSIEHVESINRVGKVISAPKSTIIEPGDSLLFHHNICRNAWGLKGVLKRSVFQIKENVFYYFLQMKSGIMKD